MSTNRLYGESEHSQSVQTYLRWLKGNPSRELKLIVKIALRHCRPPMQLEDLIAEGNLALLLAHQEYETKKLVSPKSTYIYVKVRLHMLEFLQLYNTSYLPDHEREEVGDMDSLPSNDKNIVKQIEIKEEGKTFISVINGIKSDEKRRQQSIFKMVYGIGRTFPVSYDDAGKEFNLTGERIRQLSDIAIDRISWQLHNKGPYYGRAVKRKWFISQSGIKWALDSYYH